MSELAIPDDQTPAVRRPGADLDPEAAELIERAPSENTLRAYNRWALNYVTWCATRSVVSMPAAADTFANYVTHLVTQGKGVPTIRIAMAAVRWVHALNGHKGHPPNELALLALRTHRKRQAAAGARRKQATPILLPDLRAMLDACQPDTYRGMRDRFVLVIGWTGMLRRSELAALKFGDVTEVPDGLNLYIAQSKTDKDAEGAEVPLPRGTHPETDPPQVFRDYLAAAATANVTDGYLLRGIDRGGRITGQLTGYAINELVKEAAKRAGLPNAATYTAHALRAGGATQAYRNGAPVSSIAGHGRWAPNSPVVLGYIRAVDKWKDNPMRGIGL